VLLATVAVWTVVAQPAPWPDTWVTTVGMQVQNVEHAADGRVETFMRAAAPLRAGAFLTVDVRSAIKVTHVVLSEGSSEFLQAGRLTTVKRGKRLTVATFGGASERTRTPSGDTVITLVPPLKLVHFPFELQSKATTLPCPARARI
jgi:hypothetical protein